MAKRPETRRLSTRRSREAQSSPEQLTVSQPITSGDAGSKADQFNQLMEGIKPGFRALAQQHDKEHRETQESMSNAKAISEHIQGSMPEDIEKEAQQYEDPTYREGYRAKRMKLYANEQVASIKEEIAENKNKPGFDAEELWSKRSQEILKDVPDDLKGEVADQIGIAHGSWKKNSRKKALENQKVESKNTYLSDLDNHFSQVKEAGGVPNAETMEAQVTEARELNISETDARARYLDWAGRKAVEEADPKFLAELSHLRNDPELSETYQKYVSKAKAEKDKQASVSEVEARDEYQTLARNGEFDYTHVREIAEDPELRELWSEPALAQMLRQSKRNRQKGQEESALVHKWLNQPNDVAAEDGADLSDGEFSEVMDKGLKVLQERYPDDPEKAFKMWAERVAMTGARGVNENLKQQLIARGSAVDMDVKDGQIPQEFLNGYNQYRALREEVAGGDKLVTRHLEGGTASEARTRFEIFHDLKKNGFTDDAAFGMTKRMTNDVQSMNEFKDTDAYQDLQNALDDLPATQFSGEGKAEFRKMAEYYGRYGLSPDKSIKLAKERYNRNHSTVRGVSFNHAGRPEKAQELEGALDWFLSSKNQEIREVLDSPDLVSRVREQAGDPNLSMEDVTARQSQTDPDVVQLHYGGTPLGIPLEASKLIEGWKNLRSEQQRLTASQGHPFGEDSELPSNEGHPRVEQNREARKSQYSAEERERMRDERLDQRKEDLEEYKAFEKRVGHIFSQFKNPPNYDEAPGTPPLTQAE